MRLKVLTSSLESFMITGPQDAHVTSIAYDSRAVTEGSLFAAIRGENFDGHSFIKDAVRRRCSAVLAEEPDPATAGGIPLVLVPDSREALARISARFYGEPAKHMTLIGVTGTNGKTTTTYLIESVLKEAGLPAGVMGTVNYRYGGRIFPAPHTTPEAPELQKMLHEMHTCGVRHCAMEVSSHAVKQKRVFGCMFDAAIFTNLTPEHLDYHLTMEDYYSSKATLFKELLKEGGTPVVNVDDPWGRRLAGELTTSFTFSLEKGSHVYPEDYRLSEDGTRASVRTPAGTIEVSSPLVGEYNLANILGVVAASLSLGLDLRTIKRGIEAMGPVPGRLEKIPSPYFTAYVDYAHTHDALERVLLALKGVAAGRLITVFGCGGNRDRAKRPRMGEVAVRHSAITIVTSDNPRNEDPLEIIGEIESGISGVKKYGPADSVFGEKGYLVIPDRREAIKKAVEISGKGDTLLIAGKGHEDCQIVGAEKIHFDDREVVRSVISALQG